MSRPKVYTREWALALADELAARRETPKAYCWRHGVSLTALRSRALRAGVRLGVEIRLRRVRAIETAKFANPKLSYERLALDAGWSSPSAFIRARKSLRVRWNRAA